jgi:hypothetical protein
MPCLVTHLDIEVCTSKLVPIVCLFDKAHEKVDFVKRKMHFDFFFWISLSNATL